MALPSMVLTAVFAHGAAGTVGGQMGDRPGAETGAQAAHRVFPGWTPAALGAVLMAVRVPVAAPMLIEPGSVPTLAGTSRTDLHSRPTRARPDFPFKDPLPPYGDAT